MGDLDGKKNRHLSLELCLSGNKESSQIQGNSRVRAKTLDQLGKPEWKRIRGNVGEIAVDTHTLTILRALRFQQSLQMLSSSAQTF